MHHHNQNMIEPYKINLFGKQLLMVTVLNLLITIVQIIGEIFSNSWALLSGALHSLGDYGALFLAYIANKISRRKLYISIEYIMKIEIEVEIILIKSFNITHTTLQFSYYCNYDNKQIIVGA